MYGAIGGIESGITSVRQGKKAMASRSNQEK
jgi:hypothetical protein